MKLLTEVHIAPTQWQIDYHDSIMMIGSCFASEMATQLEQHCFQIHTNPFGVLYNPLSIAACIERVASGQLFTQEELIEHGGLWHSMLHHGDFSHPTIQETLSHINRVLLSEHQAWSKHSVAVLTLGTAWVYEQDGQIVGNCHKLPANRFTRRRLSVDEIVERLGSMECLREKHVLLTVSPIRHIKDGLHENQLSKSTLLLAADRLVEQHENFSYFPSYEIVLDELRDYRYYAEDMVHPSSVAVQYIWERFANTYLSDEARALMPKMHRLWQDWHHRPLHPDSENYRTFAARRENELALMLTQYPWLESLKNHCG